jgi:murein DD-endopeptidase MepM/ murein hydrolase activator NlpD
VNQNTARRIRQAMSGPALIGAIACSAFVTDAAAAESSPPWLVSADVQMRPTKVVRGIAVRPEPVAMVLPVQGYRLTARFGSSGGLWAGDHTGLDFAAPEGTAIHAIADGVVTEVGYDGSYGNKTVLRLEDGTELWFCHQSAQSVSVGDRVSAGQVIGAIGSTGNVTGPHLHLEVRVHGEPIDPEIALADWGLDP